MVPPQSLLPDGQGVVQQVGRLLVFVLIPARTHKAKAPGQSRREKDWDSTHCLVWLVQMLIFPGRFPRLLQHWLTSVSNLTVNSFHLSAFFFFYSGQMNTWDLWKWCVRDDKRRRRGEIFGLLLFLQQGDKWPPPLFLRRNSAGDCAASNAVPLTQDADVTETYDASPLGGQIHRRASVLWRLRKTADLCTDLHAMMGPLLLLGLMSQETVILHWHCDHEGIRLTEGILRGFTSWSEEGFHKIGSDRHS